jgi:hypothetical protein
MTQTSGPTGPDPTRGGGIFSVGFLWERAELYVRRNVAWNRLYRAASYFRSSLWVIPFVSIPIVLAVAPGLRISTRSSVGRGGPMA